jgi:hypothetical protein
VSHDEHANGLARLAGDVLGDDDSIAGRPAAASNAKVNELSSARRPAPNGPKCMVETREAV